MKRIIIIILGIFTIFTFNFCDKVDSPEEPDDCKQYYHYKADVTVEIIALEDGQPMVGQNYWAGYSSYKCGLSPTSSGYSGTLDSNGYAKLPLTFHHNFLNNHDYVVWKVQIGSSGNYERTVDYRDFNGVDFREIEIQAVFDN